jgi:hypothetical protein
MAEPTSSERRCRVCRRPFTPFIWPGANALHFCRGEQGVRAIRAVTPRAGSGKEPSTTSLVLDPRAIG